MTEPEEIQYLRIVRAHGLRLTPPQLALLNYIDWLHTYLPPRPSSHDPAVASH